MSYILPFILSFLVHIGGSFLLDTNGKHGSQDKGTSSLPKEKPGPILVRIIEKPKLVEQKSKIETKEYEDLRDRLNNLVKKKAEPTCENFYYGIGISHPNADSCKVLTVYKGYPADLNGVKSGDEIISPECDDIVSDSEKPINLIIKRGDQLVNLSFNRGKICSYK